MTTVFLVHATADRQRAHQLADFLEFGCDVICYRDDGLISYGTDILMKAEEGLSADVLVLLLSTSSSPAQWVRDRWEPLLFDEAKRLNVDVVPFLLEECRFPALLRRRNFIDATTAPLRAMRVLKRRLWNRGTVRADFSSDLEELYTGLADRAGTMRAEGDGARRFAGEAAQEFEAVLWIPSHGRSLAQISGQIGADLGLALEGTVEENCAQIRDFLARHRCLLVLDAPPPEFVSALLPDGRTSTLITAAPVNVVETPDSPAEAQTLIAAGRYAEAYEMLRRLLEAGAATEMCARELVWICERWDRLEEANSLRYHFGPAPVEQLKLF